MKNRNSLRFVLWTVMIAVSIYNIVSVVKIVQNSDNEQTTMLIEKIYGGITEQAMAVYLPGLLYQTKQQDDHDIILEDESTCESIIEINGRTIADRLLAENQGQAIAQENESALDQAQEQPDEATQTAEATPAEQPVVAQTTPLFDLSMESLANFDYLLNNFFVVDANTTVDSSILNAQEFIDTELTISGDNTTPQILIYHTHSQEAFADSNENDPSTTVVGLGDYLTEILTDTYGYNVRHDTQTYDIMPEGHLDRSKAYSYAREGLQEILAENPDIEVVIDLHRDGVSEDKHLVTEIDGKPTAQIMYFNGVSYTNQSGALDNLYNPYIKDNLAFSFRLEYEAAQYYPYLTRCIYLKGYRYNLDLRPKSILLEVGAQTNTVEEARNAMAPFAYILNKVLKGE